MNEHGKPKFVAKEDPLSTIRNNKLIAQGEKLKTSAKLRGFVSNISSLRLSGNIRGFCFLYFAAFRLARSHSFFCSTHLHTACVQRNLKVILIKNHGKSLLFGYYKLGFRCLELNLFFASLLRFERL